MIADMQRRIDQLTQELERLRSQTPVRSSPSGDEVQTVLVIGGQTFGSYNGITYSATVTPTQIWDADVDTSGYPAGLGYGTLFSNGASMGNVLIRWNGAGGRTSPLLEGRSCRVLETESLTVVGGPDDGAILIAYVVGWE